MHTGTGIVIGVDTHKHVHVAHAADDLGRSLGDYQMPTTAAGYAEFLAWARYLRAEGVFIREVGRPNRQRRARYGKTDTLDARGAAAIVLAGQDSGQPKDADGDIEMLRVLKVTCTSAVNAKVIAITAMQDLIVTAPPAVREQFTGLSSRRLITA